MPTTLQDTFSVPKALRFGAATGDRVNLGGAADITGFTKLSVGILANLTTLTSSRQLGSKTNNPATRGWAFELADTTGNLDVFFGGSGTSLQYNTTGNPVVLNRWQFMSAVIDTSLGAGLKAIIYVSPDLVTPLAAATISVVSEGGASVLDTTADVLWWGNLASLTAAIQGQLALAWLAPGVNYSLQDRKSTRLNSSHLKLSRMPSSA